MNVFVVGTGRCGTTTFSKACSHATNMTSCHEGAAGTPYSLIYSSDHIEIDPPLSFWVPELRRIYPGCKFVHLVREPRGCVASMVRNDPEICKWFGRMVYHSEETTELQGAIALYRVVNDLIYGDDVLRVKLETIREQWQEVWDWMGCEGDFNASLQEWEIRHNASQ